MTDRAGLREHQSGHWEKNKQSAEHELRAQLIIIKIAFFDCHYLSLAEEKSGTICPGKVRSLHNIVG